MLLVKTNKKSNLMIIKKFENKYIQRTYIILIYIFLVIPYYLIYVLSLTYSLLHLFVSGTYYKLKLCYTDLSKQIETINKEMKKYWR